MRTLKVIVALLLVCAGAAGCGLFHHDSGRAAEGKRLQRLLDENPMFTVFLRSDATEAQRRDIEAAVRALPGFAAVTFVDHDAAYRRMKQAFAAEPSKMPQFDPELLPESFEVRMTDSAAVRKTRDARSALDEMPGVSEVVFRCTTLQECKETSNRRPSTSPT